MAYKLRLNLVLFCVTSMGYWILPVFASCELHP